MCHKTPVKWWPCWQMLTERKFQFLYKIIQQHTKSTAQQNANKSSQRLLLWLVENIRGKYCSVPAHQKQGASETTVLYCRANNTVCFFDNVEFGKASLETASSGFCVQVYQTVNTIRFNRHPCKQQHFLFLIEKTKQTLKCLLELKGNSCFRSITKIAILNVVKWHILDRDICFVRQKVDSPPWKD